MFSVEVGSTLTAGNKTVRPGVSCGGQTTGGTIAQGCTGEAPMLRAKTLARRVIGMLAGLAVAGLIVVLYVVPTWEFLRQPAGEKWVEVTADWLAATTAGAELETLADQLMAQHDRDALELPSRSSPTAGEPFLWRDFQRNSAKAGAASVNPSYSYVPPCSPMGPPVFKHMGPGERAERRAA